MAHRIPLLFILVGLALFVFAACGPSATSAPTTELPAATQKPLVTDVPTAIATEAPPALTGDISRGGRLYDEWVEELDLAPPEGNQPLWATQTTNTRSGGVTWRCKECHGWDYMGAEGAYGSGSHKTGFVGVMGVSGKDPSEILGILKGSTSDKHDFSAYMDDQALTDMALFLSGGLIDSSSMVNAGKTFFNDTCQECHGPQGMGINFGNSTEPEYQGNVAVANPLEFIHKMRFGQPGVADMPSLVDDGVDDNVYTDVLAYVATFPTSSPISEGGVMYDNWMEAMGVDAPAVDQPLFGTQTTNTRTGEDTWRCKECHGWDYLGVDGAYGSGSHKTGFKGISESSSMSAEDLTAWLNGTNNPDHNFTGEGMMGDAQVQMMVAYIQSEKIDSSAFIKADKTVTGGNAENGAEFFGTACAYCHGEDGKTHNFGNEAEPEYVGTVAADNPWEFVHKVSFGHPGAIMPAGINMGWTLQDILDLLTYSQFLPLK